MIGEQLDREPDSDIDANDYWEFFLTRPSDMGMLASFRGSDGDPLVERLWLGGFESSSTGNFSADAVLESRDDNYDGTVDRDSVLFIDRTGSVIGTYGDDGSIGRQLERVHYNMTSQPFLMAWGDVDGDSDADSADESWVGTLWSFGWYDVRADLDLDGDVDASDYSAHAQDDGGVQVSNGGNCLSAQALYTRYGIVQAVARSMQTALGMWTSRDPLEYVDGPQLYEVTLGNRFQYTDRGGRSVSCTGCEYAMLNTDTESLSQSPDARKCNVNLHPSTTPGGPVFDPHGPPDDPIAIHSGGFMDGSCKVESQSCVQKSGCTYVARIGITVDGECARGNPTLTIKDQWPATGTVSDDDFLGRSNNAALAGSPRTRSGGLGDLLSPPYGNSQIDVALYGNCGISNELTVSVEVNGTDAKGNAVSATSKLGFQLSCGDCRRVTTYPLSVNPMSLE